MRKLLLVLLAASLLTAPMAGTASAATWPCDGAWRTLSGESNHQPQTGVLGPGGIMNAPIEANVIVDGVGANQNIWVRRFDNSEATYPSGWVNIGGLTNYRPRMVSYASAQMASNGWGSHGIRVIGTDGNTWRNNYRLNFNILNQPTYTDWTGWYLEGGGWTLYNQAFDDTNFTNYVSGVYYQHTVQLYGTVVIEECHQI